MVKQRQIHVHVLVFIYRFDYFYFILKSLPLQTFITFYKVVYDTRSVFNVIKYSLELIIMLTQNLFLVLKFYTQVCKFEF